MLGAYAVIPAYIECMNVLIVLKKGYIIQKINLRLRVGSDLGNPEDQNHAPLPTSKGQVE